MHDLARFALVVVAVPLLGLAACGGGGGGKPASTTPAAGPANPYAPAAPGTHAVPALPGTVACYGGKGDAWFPGGTVVGGIEIFLRRAWDPATSTIVEDQVTLQSNVGSRTWVTAKVDGEKVALDGKYYTGKYTGSGTGTGEAPFASWIYDIQMDQGGITGHTTYELAGGGLKIAAVISGADGQPIIKFDLTLASLDDAGCQAAFSRFKPL